MKNPLLTYLFVKVTCSISSRKFRALTAAAAVVVLLFFLDGCRLRHLPVVVVKSNEADVR